MSYSNLEKDAAYAPGQSGESLVPPETTMGERFNLGWDRKALDSGFNAKQFNRDRIFPQLIDKALEDGDTEKAKAIADEANTLKIRNYEEMGMSSLNIFSNIANVVQSKFGDNTISPIEQEQIDQVNTEILALDKKIEKYDGFFNMITLGSMAKELTHPAILMSLPLSMYGATGRAAIGAGATNALRANASYTFARELGIAALSELYIQTQAYKYSQIREDEDRGIKAMTFTDVTANIAINSLFAASAAAGGSAIWDFGKIKFQGAKTFEKGESVEAFLRTRGQQGVDKVQLQKLLEETTFDNKVDPMVVAEIKRHIDTSPSADINLHTAQMTKAAHDLESKGYVDLENDNISKNIDEANTNDFINVVDGDGNTLIGRVLHSTDKEVTIQYGDKEVKIDRETGEAIGEDLSAAPADPITTPEPQARNVNKVNTQQDTQEISPQQQQELITKYENDPDVIEASREIDESMAHFEDILGIEPEVVAKEVPEATPGEVVEEVDYTAAQLHAFTDDDLIAKAGNAQIDGEAAVRARVAEAEAKVTPEIKKYTIDNMDQHPRYNELLTMRQNATAYESKNPNNLVSKREYKTENTGKGYETEVIPAQHERNYNYDFQLSKQDVKSIINGKATDEVKQKAVDDLEFMDNSPEWQADQAQLDMEADILFSKAGPELLGGSVAGIEEDEDGNITIDPAAFVAGMLLGHTAKKLGSNPKVQKEVLQSLERIAEDIVKKYPMLNVVPQFAQELEALFLKDDKIVEATLMKDAKELPDPFTSKEAFSKGRSNKVKTPIGDVKVNLNKAYDHLTNNTHNKDRSNLSGAFFETLENPLFVVKKPYKDTENTIFYKPFKSKDGNKHIVSFTVDKKGELINKTFYDYNLEKLKKLIKVPDEDLVYLDKPSLKGSSKDANLYNGDPEIPEGSVSKDIIPQKAVKPPKELLVTHNLTEANLKFAEEKGGMIAPSIAITKADEILDGFGEITLIGDKGIVEPSSKTKTFGADIYSPRYPKVYSNTTVKQDRAIQQELDPYYQQVGETRELPTDGVSELYDNVAFKAKFLESKGIKPKIIKSKRVAKEVQDRTNKYFSDFVDLKSKDFVDAQQLRFNPEFQKQVLQELEDVDPGIVKALDMGDPIGVDASKELKRIAYKRASDIGRLKESVKKAGKIDPDETRYAIRDLINKKKLGQELTEYAQDFLRRQGAKEELYAGTDSQGRQKYKSHTVDNVLKAMKKDLRSGENFNYGVGSIRAKLTPEFKSIQQIINNKDRLVTKEIFDQSKEEITNKYQEIQESLKPYYEYDQNSFGYGDEVGYMLAEGATPKAMREYGFKDVPGYLQEEVDDLVNAMREMPTEYFETKILDQVDAGIFKAAVVPNGTSKETIQMLKDKGIKVTKYNTGEDGSRKAAVNKAAEKGKLLFMHPAATGGAIVATGMTAAEISNYKEQEL